MAAPAQVNTLRSTDFPEGVSDRAAADKLFQILNPFLQQVGSVTTQGTSLGQNVDGQAVAVSVTTPASDWTPITVFTGGWTASVAVAYRRTAGGEVELRGSLTGGAGTAFTLPAGFFPAQAVTIGLVGVTTAGVVTPTAATSLDAVSFTEVSNTPGVLSCFPQNVRLKDRKAPKFVLVSPYNTSKQRTETALLPAWTYLGSGAMGNLLRLDNVPGLVLGTKYTLNLFVFF